MLDHAKIKRLRLKQGLSQGDAAKLAGFKTRQQWSNVERNATGYSVSMATLERMAKALGVKARELLK
jgi:transcriptional regulator with XRE-family HTH domain